MWIGSQNGHLVFLYMIDFDKYYVRGITMNVLREHLNNCFNISDSCS